MPFRPRALLSHNTANAQSQQVFRAASCQRQYLSISGVRFEELQRTKEYATSHSLGDWLAVQLQGYFWGVHPMVEASGGGYTTLDKYISNELYDNMR
jgi:hypothetical protein